MRSFRFPQMFNTNSSNIWKSSDYNKMTKQNAILLLHCERGELFGDPYFGLMLKHYLFDQNNYILKDAIIDVIYNQLALFMPQIRVKRDDIDIIQDKARGRLICKFIAQSQIDYQVDNYSLVLFEESDE